MRSYLHRREPAPIYPADVFTLTIPYFAALILAAGCLCTGWFGRAASDRAENERTYSVANELLRQSQAITVTNTRLFNGAAAMLRRSVIVRQEARDLLDAVAAQQGGEELPAEDPTPEPSPAGMRL